LLEQLSSDLQYMKKLVECSFLGTNYCGFQVQPNGISIQEKLQDALEALCGIRLPIVGCSRTDSGVHANQYYFTFDLDESTVKDNQFVDGLNHFLPDDISIRKCISVGDDFHPRYNCLGKEYQYLIWNKREKNPFYTDRAMHVPYMLNETLMNTAAQQIEGLHDFTSFCAANTDVQDKIRNIEYCKVVREEDFIKIFIKGDGFLYNMVRIITGTLIDVSRGKIEPLSISKIIEEKNRSLAGFTAPPIGLYLNQVFYENISN